METDGIIPSCRNHRHLSRGKAEELVAQRIVFRDDDGNFARLAEARWVGKHRRFMTFIRSREWKRLSSAGVICMQLVPAGGAW